MPDSHDESFRLQLGHLADAGRRAVSAKLACFVVNFWDDGEQKDAYACVVAHEDGADAKNAHADGIYAVLMAAQTLLDSIDHELLIKDRQTGEVMEFKIFNPHRVEVEVPDTE